MKSSIKDIKDSLNYWGVGRIFTYGVASYAISQNELSEKRKLKFSKDLKKYSKKITKTYKKPSLNVRVKYTLFRLLQKYKPLNLTDNKYWIDSTLINKKPY
jgi:hypothetical protein